MMEFLLVVLTIVGSFWAGWKLREVYAKHMVSQMQTQLAEFAKEVQSHIVEVIIEDVNGQYFVYNAKTGEFLAQGADHKTIGEVLNKRFPDTIFTADRINLQKIGYPNDTV